jgi:CHAP domain
MKQTNLSKETILSAITQLGVEEVPKGSNAGTDVEKYLKSVGLGKGFSWCMAFVYWNVLQACTKLKIPNPILKTGGVLAQYNYPKNQRFTKPQQGDIFIMDFGKGQGHTGFVEYVLDDTIHTIEGNTNDDGSREGYEVCRRVRKIASIKGFIRI